MTSTMQRIPFLMAFWVLAAAASAQTFVKITDAGNPIVSFTPSQPAYAGASWIDIDNDGDLDLFVNDNFLFRNDGNGEFTRLTNTGIQSGWQAGQFNSGHSWGDFDNDGYWDLFMANRQSGLFRNNGDGTFSHGPLPTQPNGWAAAFADYDRDGWLDIVVTHPCGFIGPCHPNWLFRSDGNGGFTEVSGNDVTTGNAAYTVANWSDFDLDGDMDLFIGSGEISAPSKDHIYLNQLTETGSPDLVRQDQGTLFGDLRDGQLWNWIDFDNDGDLDGFVTNYLTAQPNDFYRNDGNGSFTKLTTDDLGGADMVSAPGNWLNNIWGDFDNDGDLDAYVSNDGADDRYYRNNGDGTFTSLQMPFLATGGARGAAAGDYDNDGDLDLFIGAVTAAGKGLYRNEDGNANNWASFTLVGTVSNRSAIGARVRLKATLGGKAVWQLRELSSQNSFCGMNSPRIHFGLADAQRIDSVLIEWPSGLVEAYENLEVNMFCTITEGQGNDCLVSSLSELPADVQEWQVLPNPASRTLMIRYVLVEKPHTPLQLTLFDSSGRSLRHQALPPLETSGTIHWNDLDSLPAGVYWLTLTSAKGRSSRKVVLKD